ncbi:peptide chain release factor 1 [Planoprotostelium fungivorum]|uniref:Peptide chain release factor 1 n=1 Tax=Planoprotostelium fungivorum TaxID=1890364 RepID=A0A2P6N3C5_9EUKA|nr:peptide chain release factor 1 [Planoprotostelium fungivorum]
MLLRVVGKNHLCFNRLNIAPPKVLPQYKPLYIHIGSRNTFRRTVKMMGKMPLLNTSGRTIDVELNVTRCRINFKLLDRLKQKHMRYQELSEKLNSSEISNTTGESMKALTKEYNELSEVSSVFETWEQKRKELSEAETVLRLEKDEEIRAWAAADVTKCHSVLQEMESDLISSLIPKDQVDDRNAILEVRAGTGGLEASLFASEMFEMYQRYAESKGWDFSPLNTESSDVGGYKEASALIKGRGVFGRLKFETGVHRVQRVPATEANGRVHTSTMTVAILPEAKEIDIHLDEKDVRMDTYRSSGAGGQHVNTTDSAVRLTHIPTGIVVCNQDDRSQLRNKDKAFTILRSRLYEMERQKIVQERNSQRTSQIGTGGSSWTDSSTP